jgi:hypothetical protein
MTDLCILYLESPWGENEGHERGREEHLEDGNVAFSCFEAFCERVCSKYPEASSCTNREVAIVLVEGNEIHGHVRCISGRGREMLQCQILMSGGRHGFAHRLIAGGSSLAACATDLPRKIPDLACMWKLGPLNLHFNPSPGSICELTRQVRTWTQFSGTRRPGRPDICVVIDGLPYPPLCQNPFLRP